MSAAVRDGKESGVVVEEFVDSRTTGERVDVLPKIMADAMPACEKPLSVRTPRILGGLGLTMPINGANLGLNSDSAMVGRWGAEDNQALVMGCVQKRMKVAKPTTSACISNSCNELHLPGRSAKVTCSRGSPAGAKPGRDAPRAHRPSSLQRDAFLAASQRRELSISSPTTT